MPPLLSESVWGMGCSILQDKDLHFDFCCSLQVSQVSFSVMLKVYLTLGITVSGTKAFWEVSICSSHCIFTFISLRENSLTQSPLTDLELGFYPLRTDKVWHCSCERQKMYPFNRRIVTQSAISCFFDPFAVQSDWKIGSTFQDCS